MENLKLKLDETSEGLKATIAEFVTDKPGNCICVILNIVWGKCKNKYIFSERKKFLSRFTLPTLKNL